MPNLPSEAGMTDEQIRKVTGKLPTYDAHSKFWVSSELRDAVDAASEHTWAYLEPVLQGLVEASIARESYENSTPNPFGHDCRWCQSCVEEMANLESNALAAARRALGQ